MPDTSNQLASSDTVSFDSVQPVSMVLSDTYAVTVSGTTVVSASDMSKENQH